MEEAEFAPALLKQVCCAGSTVPWLRGRQRTKQCAGQDERYWDNVSIAQYPVSLKLIHVSDSGVLCIMSSCDSVCFGSVLFTKSGRFRNRWLGKTCVTGILFSWVQWGWMKVGQLRCWFTYLQKICCVKAVCLNWYGTDYSFLGESSRLDWELLLGANVLYFYRSEKQLSNLNCGQMVQNLFGSVN